MKHVSLCVQPELYFLCSCRPSMLLEKCGLHLNKKYPFNLHCRRASLVMVKSNDFPECAFSHGNQYTARDLPFMLDCQILNKSPFQHRAKKELLGYWQTF